MNRTESVGDVQLRHGSHLFGKGGVVFSLARFKPGVFQKHDLAGLQRRGLGLGVGAHGVGGKDHGSA
ncbi:hypothetical protein SDC9_69764 [bioreactor metagenome]|uniref:Uncharacterized protein n=1 Tax=bioreactor metagenome TaxID=1076179 RepID=A0A644Y9P8_9ZZZZ